MAMEPLRPNVERSQSGVQFEEAEEDMRTRRTELLEELQAFLFASR